MNAAVVSIMPWSPGAHLYAPLLSLHPQAESWGVACARIQPQEQLPAAFPRQGTFALLLQRVRARGCTPPADSWLGQGVPVDGLRMNALPSIESVP